MIRMSEIALSDTEELTTGGDTGIHRPSFMFAKRHGVLVAGEENGKVVVLHRAA